MINKSIHYLLIFLFLAGIQLIWPTADAFATADLSILASADIFDDEASTYDLEAEKLYVGYLWEYNGVNRSALKFDLNTINSSKTIQKAELKIYIYEANHIDEGVVGDPTDDPLPWVNIWGSNDDAWTEFAGATRYIPATVSLGALSSANDTNLVNHSWKYFDVTDYIIDQYAGDKTASFVLTGPPQTPGDSTCSFSFDFYDRTISKDLGDGHGIQNVGAHLEITYAGAPTANTNAAGSITTTEATLNGTVNANGDSTAVTFEYGTTTAYGSTVTADQSPVSGTTATAVSKALSGLTPMTTYHYRVKAVSAGGTATGDDQSFTTPAAAPTATSSAASTITTTGATLNGSVNANNASITVTFEYGTTTAYGTEATAAQSPVSGTATTAVSADIGSLSSVTTYHYRVKAVSAGGTTTGEDQTFTTLTPPPTVTSDAGTAVTRTGSTLNGTVNANGGSTTVTFEYGTTTAYGTTVTADQSPATGTADTAVSKVISGLIPNTTYHYRAKGVSAGGTINGGDQTFTTPAAAPAATTNAAGSITTTGATLNGTVNANNASTTVTFEYGTTTAYGSSATAAQSPVSGTATTAVSADIGSLSSVTTYHYRVKAVNSGGTSYSADQSFTTLTASNGSTGGGSGGNTGPSAVNTTTGSAQVYPNMGGKVALGNEAEVNIPANALLGTTALSVTVDRVQGPAAPAGFMVLGNVYEMKVSGQSSYQFNQPVTLTFTFDPSQVPPGFSPTIEYYDSESEQWVNLGGTISGNTISITTLHSTKYAVMVKKAKEKDLPVPPPVKELSDIRGHWAEAAIKYLVDLKAIVGYPDNTFRPDKTVSRGEFTTVLVKALNLSSTTPKTFKDASGHWAENYISIAAANGIVSGYNETTFGPNDPITREQMAVMVVRAAKLDKKAGASAFADDNNISGWARDYINSAVDKKILSVGGDKCFRPKANASRAEAAMMLYRVLTK
ncbi:MAG: S-layer homology domain-containing protein [Syntrophomonadaceae bacterium]|jgi:phosphodiesterase/alkaline phosphatase D-like protein